MRLELSADADADLFDILEYGVQTFGHEVGHAYYFSFDSAFSILRDFPQAGSVREDIDETIRAFRHRSHKIYYDVTKDTIIVQRILHHAMDVPSRLG